MDSENTLLNENTDTAVLVTNDKCDKVDYAVAVGCGVVAGLVDIFFVGSAQNSLLGTWADSTVDNCVELFAKKFGWNGQSIESAIGFLEKKFKVNFDQRYSSDVGNVFSMNTKNHHFKSLAHSPDIAGLFFSVLNQFTSTSSFISNGSIITIDTESFDLQGDSFISKLFCGIVNWIGHLMSDIAGSSGGRGNGGRGSGIVIPFYELLGLCDFGKFSIGKDKQSLAILAERVFKEGYDFRYGLTMAIPVVLCDAAIRLFWGIRRLFQYKKPLQECIPTNEHSDLRVMLLFGKGTLSIMDTAEAAICSGGNWLVFFCKWNILAFAEFLKAILVEIYTRAKMAQKYKVKLETLHSYESIELYIERQKRMLVELKCRKEIQAIREFRRELEFQAESFFTEYSQAFNEASRLIDTSLANDDMNGFIEGSNMLIDKLGGDVYFRNMDEFDKFMNEGSNKK